MDSPLKEFGKDYFRQLLSQTHENMKIGDELNIGIIFYDEEGEISSKVVETIDKDELC